MISNVIQLYDRYSIHNVTGHIILNGLSQIYLQNNTNFPETTLDWFNCARQTVFNKYYLNPGLVGGGGRIWPMGSPEIQNCLSTVSDSEKRKHRVVITVMIAINFES
jgi:hypothetical protein